MVNCVRSLLGCVLSRWCITNTGHPRPPSQQVSCQDVRGSPEAPLAHLNLCAVIGGSRPRSAGFSLGESPNPRFPSTKWLTFCALWQLFTRRGAVIFHRKGLEVTQPGARAVHMMTGAPEGPPEPSHTQYESYGLQTSF